MEISLADDIKYINQMREEIGKAKNTPKVNLLASSFRRKQ